MFQKQKPNFGVHFKTFIVMATICPLGRPLGWKTPNKTYFEILWGGPRGENKNKHENNQKNIFGISLRRTQWRKPNKLWKKQKHWKHKKTYSETLGLPSPIPKTSGKLFFLDLFGFTNVFLFFSMFFGVSFFLVFQFWFPNVLGFSNIFSVFSMGSSPKRFQICSFGFSHVYFCFLHGALPKESQNIFFWCFPAYNVVHKRKQQKSNGKTVCVSSGWLESHREGRHLDQTYYVHVCFAGMGKR